MTYAIHMFTDRTKSYIGYETMDDYNYKDMRDTRADIFAKRPDLNTSTLSYRILRTDVEEAELWKSLCGFMDAYDTVENGYNTEEEYEEASAHIIIKQNPKAATQNQVESSEDWTGTIFFQNGSEITPTPHKSRRVITIGKNDLISLAAEHSLSSNAIVLYLYLNTVSGNQFTDATLEQAAKDLDLSDGIIKMAYDGLVEAGLIEELRTFQTKRI